MFIPKGSRCTARWIQQVSHPLRAERHKQPELGRVTHDVLNVFYCTLLRLAAMCGTSHAKLNSISVVYRGLFFNTFSQVLPPLSFLHVPLCDCDILNMVHIVALL